MVISLITWLFFFAQGTADCVSDLETLVSENSHAAEARKASNWPYLAPETSDEQQRFSQRVQQFLETVVMVVEAVPKSYGTDDVRNSTINFIMRVKWLAWGRRNDRQIYLFSLKSQAKRHSLPDQWLWRWDETSSTFHPWCPHHLHPAGGWALWTTTSFLRGYPLLSPAQAAGTHWC